MVVFRYYCLCKGFGVEVVVQMCRDFVQNCNIYDIVFSIFQWCVFEEVDIIKIVQSFGSVVVDVFSEMDCFDGVVFVDVYK